MNFFIRKNKAFLSWETADLSDGPNALRSKLQGILPEVLEAGSCTLNWKQLTEMKIEELGVFLSFLSYLKLKEKSIQITLNPELAQQFQHFPISEYFGSFVVEEVQNG